MILRSWRSKINDGDDDYCLSLSLFCFGRNEIIPRLKEYNTFFEGRKALQLTSKEVWHLIICQLYDNTEYWLIIT